VSDTDPPAGRPRRNTFGALGCSGDRWLSGGRWPVDNIRPLMADMQAANLGVDHYGARAVGPAGQDESLWWAAPISNRG
jgi:hypothetical protein